MTVRYAEPGSSFWPVLWAPGFALLGLGVEAMTGTVHVLGWALAAVLLAGVWALWVVRRRESSHMHECQRPRLTDANSRI